jgi:hypothetical protein
MLLTMLLYLRAHSLIMLLQSFSSLFDFVSSEKTKILTKMTKLWHAELQSLIWCKEHKQTIYENFNSHMFCFVILSSYTLFRASSK